MKCNPFSPVLLLTFGLLVLVTPSSVQAANSCTASGLFSSCSVSCPADQTPLCSSGFLGLSVSCTCSGRTDNTKITVNASQEAAYAGYDDLLASFGSPESQATAKAAATMMDAARKNDVAGYDQAAAAHQESLNDLSDDELAKIYAYLDSMP